MLSVWPKIIDWFEALETESAETIFSLPAVFVCVCASVFRKMFFPSLESSSWRFGAFGGFMYHHRHYVFLSCDGTLRVFCKLTHDQRGLERKRTPKNLKLVHGKESYITDAILLFTSVIKCHYQVFFSFYPRVGFSSSIVTSTDVST